MADATGAEGPAFRPAENLPLPIPHPSATNKSMDKTITVYASFEEMKAAELREWQALPAHVRLRAVAEMTLAAYGMKEEPPQDARRIQRTLVHLERERR